MGLHWMPLVGLYRQSLCWKSLHGWLIMYNTDLMQRHTHTWVIWRYSSSTRTRLSMSINGLKLELKENLEQAVKMIIRVQIISSHQLACKLFIRWYRFLFITIMSSFFSSCCVVVTEYPTVNMQTALCLAPKFILVVVDLIYAQVHLRSLAS